MAEQRENSVLFSLKELRRLEDDRIRQEEADVRAQAEAERKAREDAERKARDDAERHRKDEEDKVRRSAEEQVARTREDQMRLAEAERRARVEAEMRLQEERMRLEMQHKKGKSPMAAIFVVGAVVVGLAGAIIYKVQANAEADKIASEQRAAAEQDRIKRDADDRMRRLEAQIAQKEKEMRAAKSEEERTRLRAEIEHASQERRRAAPPRPRETTRSQEATSAPKPLIRPKREINDNPLEGLKL